MKEAIFLYEKSYNLLRLKHGENSLHTAKCLENLAHAVYNLKLSKVLHERSKRYLRNSIA